MFGQPGYVPAAPAESLAIPLVEAVGPPVAADVVVDPNYAAGFEYVRLPNGTVVAVPKGNIQEVPATATQDAPPAVLVEVVDPHFYVWLANGDVIRVKQSDLPAPAGTNAQFGHWQIEGKVFLIVNVVPVEDNVKGAQ